MGAYFTRLAEPRELCRFVIVAVASSRSFSPLRRSPPLPRTPSENLSPFRCGQPRSATNTRDELCQPFVKIPDASLIGSFREKNRGSGTPCTRKIRRTFDPRPATSRIMPATERNLPSEWDSRASVLRHSWFSLVSFFYATLCCFCFGSLLGGVMREGSGEFNENVCY